MENDTKSSYKQRNWLEAIRTIYRLRVLQVMFVLVFLSIVFYLLDYFSSNATQGIMLQIRAFPLRALADAMLTAFLVGFTYEWIVRNESEAALAELLSRQIQTQQKAIIEEIPRALLVNPEVMAKVLKTERVDELIRTSLQVHLGDAQMGDDIYDGLLRKTLSYEQRWTNYRFKMTLSTINDTDVAEAIRQKYYNNTVDLRYDTKLVKSSFVFQCVTTIEEYNRAIRNPVYEFTWNFPPAREFPTIDASVFDVERITVNNIDLNIDRAKDEKGNLVITCSHADLANLIGRIVTIYYRYIVKINKRGHLATANVIVPTRNVVIELDYADTDIHYVNVLDFFVSTELPKITYLPSVKHAHRIEVELSEWAFPKGGVVFVWVLSKEMSGDFLAPPALHD